MRRKIGWDNGKLALEDPPLTEREKKEMNEFVDLVFRERAERTRMGSGDDQSYVDSTYEDLTKKPLYRELVEIAYKIMRDDP
jgi:hypothetical protein